MKWHWKKSDSYIIKIELYSEWVTRLFSQTPWSDLQELQFSESPVHNQAFTPALVHLHPHFTFIHCSSFSSYLRLVHFWSVYMCLIFTLIHWISLYCTCYIGFCLFSHFASTCRFCAFCLVCFLIINQCFILTCTCHL